MSNAIVTLSSIGKWFAVPGGERRQILGGISLSIERGETVALMGQNGIGKSTFANIVAGVDLDFEGSVTRPPDTSQQCPMILQDFRASLLPWLSVEANIGFPLMLRSIGKAQRLKAVKEAIALAPSRLDTSVSVSKLSGGQAQLVCVLRGFVGTPDLIVCDEPFSAIDYQARIMLRALIAKTCRERNIALLFVSHSIEDAVYLADRIVIFRGKPAIVAEEVVVTETESRNDDWLDSERSAIFRRRVRAALERKY